MNGDWARNGGCTSFTYVRPNEKHTTRQESRIFVTALNILNYSRKTLSSIDIDRQSVRKHYI